LSYTHEELAFRDEVRVNIDRMGSDQTLKQLGMAWGLRAAQYKYTYNFRWLGRPIIQLPQDLIAMQEIIWSVQPDLILETGIAHGGSLVFYASMLQLIGRGGRVLGIDVDIREHNRQQIEMHPMAKHIDMIQGSSTNAEVVARVYEYASDCKTVLVCLDSNHTHDHVLNELRLYSPLVAPGSYLIVFDTTIDEMPAEYFSGRPWGPGNNPKTAVAEFLNQSDRFEVDRTIESKIGLTVASGGYLRCLR
jgi:cephalosporin hydroxylase